MDNFDDVFHKKIASQDTGEIILFTRKSRTNFNQDVSEILKNQLIDEETEQKLQNENNSDDLSQKEPETRIEFNLYNSKIEIVPVKYKTSEPIKKNEPFDNEIIEVKSDLKNDDIIIEKDFRTILDSSPEDIDIQQQILDQIKLSQTSKSSKRKSSELTTTEKTIGENIIETNNDYVIAVDDLPAVIDSSLEDFEIQQKILDQIKLSQTSKKLKPDALEIHKNLLSHEIQPKESKIETMSTEDENSDSDDEGSC